MGRLLDGNWMSSDGKMSKEQRGRFIRKSSQFREHITADGSSGFEARPGRYHLYVSHACPWAHRTTIFRKLEKLEDVIGMSVADPVNLDEGWEFSDGPEPIRFLHELYTRSRSSYTGRVTVPTLWDTETKTVVNNESAEIIRMFDSEFDEWGDSTVRFFPRDRDDEIRAMIEANYNPVNNGVYRCGFAESQEAYDEALDDLFARLDELEVILGESRFLCGDEITAADWCLFPTLFRFDPIYAIHFKCSVRRIVDYPNLWRYARELYAVPGVADTGDIEQSKAHYYISHTSINPRQTVPRGPVLDWTI